MQELHERNDHVPYKRGCPICIAAQGRQKSHWRSGHTGQFSASFDIAGPFIAGRSFDPVSSGRDKGQGYRYFLACAYSMPLPPTFVLGSKDPPKDGECSEPEEDVHPLEVVEESPGDLVSDLPDMEELFGPAERAVLFAQGLRDRKRVTWALLTRVKKRRYLQTRIHLYLPQAVRRHRCSIAPCFWGYH